jgi:MGT family glycosyltransferase
MKILMVNLPFPGHIYPTLGLVKELVECGHDVTYILTEDWKDKIIATGAKFVAYTNHFKLSSKIRNAYDTAMHIGTDYDCIMYEQFFYLGKHLADSLQKPAIRLFSCFALNDKIIDKFVQTGGGLFGLFRSDFIRKRWTKGVKKDIQLKTKDWLSEIAHNPPGLNLTFTIRDFQLYADMFPDKHFKFIGPSISPRKSDVAIPYSDIKTPIVYVSLGTIFNNAVPFYKKCFSALKGENVTVILSVGNKISTVKLGDIPDNFFVYPFVPQLDVLQNVDLFITHGGMNSVNEALYYGVPMIVIPLASDQPTIADRVVELNLGKRLDKKKLSSQQLRETALSVLQDAQIRQNAKCMQEKMRNASGIHSATQEIVDYIKKEKESHN